MLRYVYKNTVHNFILLLFLVYFVFSVSFQPVKGMQAYFPLLTLVELVLCIFAGTDGQHHLSQQRQCTSHLLLTHPVLHKAEVGVVGCQQPQQSRMQTWVQ